MFSIIGENRRVTSCDPWSVGLPFILQSNTQHKHGGRKVSFCSFSATHAHETKGQAMFFAYFAGAQRNVFFSSMAYVL